MGVITPRSIVRAQTTASMPPLAPSVWPRLLLVLEIASRFAWPPNTRFTALVSATSPSGVLVPWALM